MIAASTLTATSVALIALGAWPRGVALWDESKVASALGNAGIVAAAILWLAWLL